MHRLQVRRALSFTFWPMTELFQGVGLRDGGADPRNSFVGLPIYTRIRHEAIVPIRRGHDVDRGILPSA
jgi:hypothetical protein